MSSTNLILRNIQFDGSHYAVISFLMPYDLGIPDDNHKTIIDWGERKLSVQIVLEENCSVVG